MSFSIEDLIFEHQAELIEAEFGKVAADRANYGWGTTETDDSPIISTKVYLKRRLTGRMVLTTSYDGYGFNDNWED